MRGSSRFELVQAVWDTSAATLVIVYDRLSGNGRARACELLRLENGRATSGEAMYGATLPAD